VESRIFGCLQDVLTSEHDEARRSGSTETKPGAWALCEPKPDCRAGPIRRTWLSVAPSFSPETRFPADLWVVIADKVYLRLHSRVFPASLSFRVQSGRGRCRNVLQGIPLYNVNLKRFNCQPLLSLFRDQTEQSHKACNCTVGHKCHDPCFHVFLVEGGVIRGHLTQQSQSYFSAATNVTEKRCHAWRQVM